jgi:hypothetical protein
MSYKRSNQVGHASLLVLLVIVIVAISGVGLLVFRHHNRTDKLARVATESKTTSGSTETTSPSFNDPALTSDMASINSSLQVENNDSTAANTAFNDQSQVITVPTN